MTSSTLADQLIAVLRQAGVERVYGVVGDSLNPVVDAIRRAGGIEWVHVRNEEAGAFAAAAEALLTGRLVTFNNSSLGMVKLEMLVDGLPDYQTDHASVDYGVIAKAAGVHALRVEQPADVRVLDGGVGRMLELARANVRNIPRPAIAR